MFWTRMVSVRAELRKTRAFDHALEGDSLHEGRHCKFTVSESVARSSHMNKCILAFLLLPRLLLAQSPSPEPTASLLLTHVTVIDATGAPAKLDMTVHVRDHRIVAVRPSSATAPLEDAVVVNASVKYLIPGLWDMHVHTGRRNIFLPLSIANGFTVVRDMGGDLEEPTGDLSARYIQLRLCREAIERGLLVGPRFVIAGFLIDGYPWPGNVSAQSAEEGRHAGD